MIEIGPFHVERRVGAGAMGQVWSGVHSRSSTPVAVKFVLSERSELEDAARSVRREARAIAGLQHPNVVYVYDQGELTASAAAQLEGVPEGSPYIVMELLSGGTLEERHRDTTWDRVRQDLERMLEGLAHCHAHGVLHRDLKPSNVLFGAPSDPRPGLKLVDFGIAWSRTVAAEALSFGTPEYCAPEQQGSEDHAQGPWTDLYALGTLAWLLVTGTLPYAGVKGPPLYLAKARSQLPTFRARGRVPTGVEDWLRCCLAGPPGDRFQSAPDALYHLRRLSGMAGDATPAREWTVQTHTAAADSAAHGLPARTASGCPDPAPLRREPLEVPLPPPALRDAGLEMWMFRPVPMTGRLAQRVRLWQRVEHSAADGQPRVLLLSGERGSGRTRVGEWLLTAARENGGILAYSTQGQSEVAGFALEQLLIRVLRISETRGTSERRENARWALEHHGADFPPVVAAVERWLGDPSDAALRMDAAVEVLRALARGRPVVLLFDDADRDPELARVANLLAAGPAVPLVIVLTAEGPVDAAAEEVPKLDAMRRRTLSQLLSNLLPLTPGSLRDAVAGAGGRPGRALDVVTSAFRAGSYRYTPRGIELDLETEDAVELPDIPRTTREWLERGAVLGVFPDGPTVNGSFRNRSAARRALEDAERRGLVSVAGDVVTFAPGVRRAILDGLTDGPARHHRALGRTLPPESADGALHRIQGGDPDGGFTQLVEAIEVMDHGTGMMHRLSYCEKGLALWESLGRDPSPGPWTDLVIHRLEAVASVEAPELSEIVRHDLELAAAHRADDAHARLLVARANLDRRTASKDLHHALTLGERPRVRTEIFHSLANHAERTGDMPLCRYWLSCATSHAESPDRAASSDAYVALGTLAAMDGLWRDAHLALDEAVRKATVPGVLDIFAANTAMVAGDLMAARSGLVRGVHWTTLRRDRRLLPGALIRLALVDLLEGQLADAESRMNEADRILAENRRQYRPDPSFGADIRLLLALEQGRWDTAVSMLGHLPGLAWPKPTRVAVFQRVNEMRQSRPIPADLREALELSETHLYALRDQWA
ncbi:MAG: serine/threonine-protein kinase [Myxococcota bacterium]